MLRLSFFISMVLALSACGGKQYVQSSDPAQRQLKVCEAEAVLRFPGQPGVISFGGNRRTYVEGCMAAAGYSEK